MNAPTRAQRAAIETARKALNEARRALRDAGDCCSGEVGRVCHGIAQECADSLRDIEIAVDDDRESVAEYRALNPVLPLFLPNGVTP